MTPEHFNADVVNGVYRNTDKAVLRTVKSFANRTEQVFNSVFEQLEPLLDPSPPITTNTHAAPGLILSILEKKGNQDQAIMKVLYTNQTDTPRFLSALNQLFPITLNEFTDQELRDVQTLVHTANEFKEIQPYRELIARFDAKLNSPQPPQPVQIPIAVEPSPYVRTA